MSRGPDARAPAPDPSHCVTDRAHPARLGWPAWTGSTSSYADRLARHASRLADELAAARLRLTWAALEREARAELGAGRSLLLESLGVLAPEDGRGADEALLARRREQLEALAALQVHVERRIPGCDRSLVSVP